MGSSKRFFVTLFLLLTMSAPHAMAQALDMYAELLGNSFPQSNEATTKQIQRARNAWSHIDPSVVQCIGTETGAGVSPLSSQGIMPNDRRLSPLLQSCRNRIKANQASEAQRAAAPKITAPKAAAQQAAEQQVAQQQAAEQQVAQQQAVEQQVAQQQAVEQQAAEQRAAAKLAAEARAAAEKAAARQAADERAAAQRAAAQQAAAQQAAAQQAAAQQAAAQQAAVQQAAAQQAAAQQAAARQAAAQQAAVQQAAHPPVPAMASNIPAPAAPANTHPAMPPVQVNSSAPPPISAPPSESTAPKAASFRLPAALLSSAILLLLTGSAFYFFKKRQGKTRSIYSILNLSDQSKDPSRDNEDDRSSDAALAYASAKPEQTRGAESREWYEVLGISPDASVDEIKAAWQNGLKQYHPDHVTSLGPKLREIAEKESKALSKACLEGLQLKMSLSKASDAIDANAT